MSRLLYGCLFILQIRQWYWTLKAFLSIKNYFCQHQNTTIIIKGECETCPISEIAIIILSLKFTGSFEAAAFSFTNLFFLPSRFSLLYGGRSFVAFLILLQQLQEKSEQKKKFSLLWAQCETLRVDWRLAYARKFHQEANGRKLSKRWLAHFSENPVDCVCVFAKQENVFSAVFSNNFFTRRGHFKSYKSKGICSIPLKFGQ